MKTAKIKYCLLLIALITTKLSYSQFFSTGTEPFSTKWEQIKTEHFKIIYPKNFYDEANRLANNLELAYPKVLISEKHQVKKIPIILHSQTIISNGYVVWAPKRMEVYTTPPQDNFNQDWLEHLTLHELRHVSQVNQLNQGITKFSSYLLGQIPIGIVSGMLPLWYWEGDAVLSETIHSKSGRGTLPSFERGLRTHFLSDENTFSFDKILFGSYKDYVPNHYESGYLMTSYTRKKYGYNVFNKVENFVAKYPFTIIPTHLPFTVGLKKETGLNQRKLFEKSFAHLDSFWTKQDIQTQKDNPKFIETADNKSHTDYLSPHFDDDSSIIALKKSLDKIPAFVRIKDGKEYKLHEPGWMPDDNFSFENGQLAWAELKYDTRWENRQFSIIKILNTTGIIRTLGKKTRFFSPSLSTNGELIVTVEVTPQNEYSLIVLNSFSGRIIEKIPAQNNHFVQKPSWSEDLNTIYTIELNPQGKSIKEYNRNSREWKTIFNIEDADIQHYKVFDEGIIYQSSLSGIDNLYFYDFQTFETFAITNSQFGIGNFDVDANRYVLINSEYSSHGYKIAERPFNKEKQDIDTNYQNEKLESISAVSSQESGIVDFSEEKMVQYPNKKYSRLNGLFNFHSWAPFYLDASTITGANPGIEDLTGISPGLMLFSQNNLSTAKTILGYGYKNGSHQVSTSFVYTGFYPVIEVNAAYGYKKEVFKTSSATWQPAQNNQGYDYTIKTYIPFNLSSGKNIMGFRPSIEFNYQNGFYYDFREDLYYVGMKKITPRVLLYGYNRMAHKDLQPKWGIVANWNWVTTPFEDELFGTINYGQVTAYIPSFIENHGIKVRIGYQKQNPKKYLYGSALNFPRGFNTITTEKLSFAKFDYIFPIAYPDWNIGSLLYIKRLRADIFYDTGMNKFRYLNEEDNQVYWYNDAMNSVGIELKMDYHFLRMIFPFNTGFRYSYDLQGGNQRFELLMGIELNNL